MLVSERSPSTHIKTSMWLQTLASCEETRQLPASHISLCLAYSQESTGEKKWLMPGHQEGWSEYCLTTWWSFCYSMEPAILNPSKSLALSRPVRNPSLWKNLMYFASYINRIDPYVHYKSFCLRPWALFISQWNSFLLLRTHVFCCYAREFLCCFA